MDGRTARARIADLVTSNRKHFVPDFWVEFWGPPLADYSSPHHATASTSCSTTSSFDCWGIWICARRYEAYCRIVRRPDSAMDAISLSPIPLEQGRTTTAPIRPPTKHTTQPGAGQSREECSRVEWVGQSYWMPESRSLSLPPRRNLFPHPYTPGMVGWRR